MANTYGNDASVASLESLISLETTFRLSEANTGGQAAGPYGEEDATIDLTTYADQNLNGLMSSLLWDVTSLSYSFPDSSTDYADYTTYGVTVPTGFSAFSVAQENAVRDWLGQVAAVSGLTFTEFDGTGGNDDVDAVLKFGNTTSASTAYAYLPDNASLGGDAWFGGAGDNPVQGNYDYHTIGHEIGHALGLSHPHESGGDFYFENPLFVDFPDLYNFPGFGVMNADRDHMEWTIMSYRSYEGAALTGYTNGSGSFAQTLMAYDVLALQTLYGANYATNSGDTTYTVDITTGEFFVDGVSQGDPVGNVIFRSVWDGAGNDTYDFSNLTTDMTVDLSAGGIIDLNSNFLFTSTDANQAALGGGNIASGHIYNTFTFNGNNASLIENAIGGSGNDVFQGNAADNYIQGNGGSDAYNIVVAGGSDTFDGGDGLDYIAFSGAVEGAYINMRSGVMSGAAANLELQNVEGFFGSEHNDFYSARWNAPLTAFGNGGNDKFYGSSMTDYIEGGAGNDLLNGNTGGSDQLYGDEGNDFLFVSAGDNNSLYGGADDDRLTGGSGNDLLFGDAGNDVVLDKGALSEDQLYGGAGSDILSAGGGNDTLDGGTESDALYGGDGNDNLIGGAGADYLAGGVGQDVYTGDAGADLFVFSENDIDLFGFESTVDVITDFEVGVDKLVLLDSMFEFGDLFLDTETAGGGADAELFLGLANSIQITYAPASVGTFSSSDMLIFA